MSDTYEFGVSRDSDMAPVGETNVLDALRTEIRRKVARPVIRIEVPERPNLAIRFSPNIRQEQMAEWRKRAGEGSKKGLNTTHFSCLIIANTCIGMVLDGVDVVDDAGNPVVFSSETMLQLTGTSKVADAVRSVYGVDPHIDMTALKILEAAGYGDDVDSENPTNT